MSAGWYSDAALKIQDPRFLFMNHGYWEPTMAPMSGEPGAYAHLLSEALVRRVLGDLPSPGTRILDVGCGRGGACAMLARETRAARVVGLDRCVEGIATCRQNVRDQRVEFIVGDAQALPFADGSFERVLNLESAHGYPDRAAFFSEVHRVLVPGGRFCYADGVPPDTLAEQAASLAEAGLIVEGTEDITEPVIEALVRSSADRRTFFDSMITANTVDLAFARRLCDALTGSIPEMYRQGTLHYYVWSCRKPDDGTVC